MNDTTRPDAFLTTRELAAALKVCEHTILRQAKKGKLQGVRVGKLWRFSPAILEPPPAVESKHLRRLRSLVLLLLLALPGCFGASPTRGYTVPATAFLLTDNPELIERVCAYPPGHRPLRGCYSGMQQIVYCLRAYPEACIHEWLHAAGLEHEAIQREGF